MLCSDEINSNHSKNFLQRYFSATHSLLTKMWTYFSSAQEISGKLKVCVDSLKQLLNLFAMEWTEGAVGDQPLGPIFHVLHPSGQPHFLSCASAKEKIQVIKVQ